MKRYVERGLGESQIWSFHVLRTCQSHAMSVYDYQLQKFTRATGSRVFIGVLLPRHGWLNHWPQVQIPSPYPLLFKRSGWYHLTQSHPCNHLVGLSSMASPILKWGAHWESPVNIKDVVLGVHHGKQRDYQLWNSMCSESPRNRGQRPAKVFVREQ